MSIASHARSAPVIVLHRTLNWALPCTRYSSVQCTITRHCTTGAANQMSQLYIMTMVGLRLRKRWAVPTFVFVDLYLNTWTTGWRSIFADLCLFSKHFLHRERWQPVVASGGADDDEQLNIGNSTFFHLNWIELDAVTSLILMNVWVDTITYYQTYFSVKICLKNLLIAYSSKKFKLV